MTTPRSPTIESTPLLSNSAPNSPHLLPQDSKPYQRLHNDRSTTSPTAYITILLFITVLTMTSYTALRPTMLLYMNYHGFTTTENITVYVIAASIFFVVPLFTNIALTKLAAFRGPAFALSTSALISASGMLLLIISQSSLPLFFTSYTLFAVCLSMGPVRVAIITQLVQQRNRTTLLAVHDLMLPLGAVLGPLVWIAAQTYRGSLMISDTVQFDRFTLNYLVSATLLVFVAIISSTTLSAIGQRNTNSPSASADLTADSTDTVREQQVDLRTYRNAVFRYFCAITFLVNVSTGLFFTTFQPVMVNVFHTTDAELGVIFEIIGVFAVVPPLVVAFLSRHLEDRQILLSGLVIKMLGMALYLPIFGRVKEWQVLMGLLLVVKASLFFSTASLSLYTKLVGRLSKPSDIGVLMSLSTLGPAITQIALSQRLVALFDTFFFALFAIPAVIGLVMLCYPLYWKRLDSERAELKLLLAQVERVCGDDV